MKTLLYGFFIVLLSYSLLLPQNNKNNIKKNYAIDYKLSEEDRTFLDTVQYKSFLYFINEMNPLNGLVKDRSASWSPASMAATGFGIVTWAIGAERGWITKAQAAGYTLALFQFLINSEQSTDTLATGYQGFYYHFVTMDSGKREWKCELSSIDTGLLLAGIIFAMEYYTGNTQVEGQIQKIGNALIKRVNWQFFMLDRKAANGPFKDILSMGWEPQAGLHDWGWLGYNEGIILYIIAAGQGMPKAEEGYSHWLSNYRWEKPYPGLEHVSYPPLFVHQYAHQFIDFRGIADSYMRDKKMDYYENSKRATLTQQKYSIDNPLKWKGYDSLVWGLSACDGPGSKYNYDSKKFGDYVARGTSGPFNVHGDDGTIAPTAAGGSIVFTPQQSIAALKEMYKKYGDKGLWGIYGFKDSFNPTLNWYAKDYIGIDQGPFVIMIENLRTGLVWEKMMQSKIIRDGLKRLDYTNIQK